MGTLTYTYRELATISVRQPYYDNGICGKYTLEPNLDLAIVPTNECQSLLTRLDALIQSLDRSGGFSVYAQVHGTNGGGQPLMRFHPNAADVMTFWMVLQNPDLVNFDDLGTTYAPSDLFYLSNVRSGPPRSNAALTASPSGLSASADIVTMTRADYRYHHPTSVLAGDVVLKHLNTGRTIAPRSVTPSAGGSEIILDLTPLPIGLCQLSVTGTPVEKRYYVGTAAPASIFGVIELSLSPTIDANFRIVESDFSLTSERPLYTITIPNRKTRWRYTVDLSSTSAIAQEIAALAPAARPAFIAALDVVTNDPTILFAQTGATDSRLVFEASRDVLLQESYLASTGGSGTRLNLSFNKNTSMGAGGTVVFDNLPYPSPGLIDARITPTIYSDVFITL